MKARYDDGPYGRRAIATPRLAIWPRQDSTVSIATSFAEVAALARVSLAPPPFPEDAARGDGQPVIVVPGFCSPGTSTARLREFLTRQGFGTHPWNLGVNIGPTKAILSGLERQIEELAGCYGRPVAVVGQSLGGTILWEVAKRRADVIARVVTIVSPIRLPVSTPLAPLAYCAAMLWDDEAQDALDELAHPPSVPVTAILSSCDGLVDWRCCTPDPAPNVEVVFVDGSHTTMGSNPAVQRVVASRLAA